MPTRAAYGHQIASELIGFLHFLCHGSPNFVTVFGTYLQIQDGMNPTNTYCIQISISISINIHDSMTIKHQSRRVSPSIQKKTIPYTNLSTLKISAQTILITHISCIYIYICLTHIDFNYPGIY